tara:strand:- start:92 stop:1240 length:1149 start_codon:yes stop_codon:yes gene_type:complete
MIQKRLIKKFILEKKIKFFLIILGIIYLLVDILSSQFYFRKGSEKKYALKDKFFHHKYERNISKKIETKEYGSYRLYTNSLGFRDSKVKDIKLKSDYSERIIFIGDSFTEGVLLNFEDTFVGIIKKELKKKNIEVLNAGIQSYSPSIYLNKVEYLIKNEKLEFDKLIVFIDISDFEDESFRKIVNGKILDDKDDYWFRTIKLSNSEKIKKNIKENFFISFSILNSLYDIMSKSYYDYYYFPKNLDKYIEKITNLNNFKRDKWTLKENLMEKSDFEIINQMTDTMQLLKNLCDMHNIELVIAVYPHMSQIFHSDLESKQVKIWSKFSKKNNINFINYFPYFISKDSSKEERIKVIKKYFIPFDMHYNIAGNKLIAEHFISNFY